MFLSICEKASTARPQSPGPFLVNLKIPSPLAGSTALWTSTVRSQVQALGTKGSFQKGTSPGREDHPLTTPTWCHHLDTAEGGCPPSTRSRCLFGAVGGRTRLSGTFTGVNMGNAAVYTQLSPLFTCLTPKLQYKTAKIIKWEPSDLRERSKGLPLSCGCPIAATSEGELQTTDHEHKRLPNPSIPSESCLIDKSNR